MYDDYAIWEAMQAYFDETDCQYNEYDDDMPWDEYIDPTLGVEWAYYENAMPDNHYLTF